MIQSHLMGERFTMTTFFIAGVVDIATTLIGTNLGLREVGPLGNIANSLDQMNFAYVTRMSVTAGLVGIYALSKKYPGRYSFSVDKALRASNVLCWGVVALNTIQIYDMIIR